MLDFFVGWEFQAYTTSEGSDSVEICMIVMIAETIIQTPAVFSYRFISSGEAIGICMQCYKQAHTHDRIILL